MAVRSSASAVFVGLLCGCGRPVILPSAPASPASVSAPAFPSEQAPEPAPAPPSAWELCTSEAARRVVLACVVGPVPTFKEYWYAYGVMHRAQRERGVFRFQDQGREPPASPRPLLAEEEQIVALSRAVACHGGSQPDERGRIVEKQGGEYQIGRTYRDASHWEEAAAALDVVALGRHVDGSDIAALEALEALDRARRNGRAECGTARRERAALYLSTLCSEPAVASPELCEDIAAVARE